MYLHDPPYNTGKDFVYTDNYAEAACRTGKDGVIDEYGVKVDTKRRNRRAFHSNWLSMMFSRLLVARQLLRPDGVIYLHRRQRSHNLRRLWQRSLREVTSSGF